MIYIQKTKLLAKNVLHSTSVNNNIRRGVNQCQENSQGVDLWDFLVIDNTD